MVNSFLTSAVGAWYVYMKMPGFVTAYYQGTLVDSLHTVDNVSFLGEHTCICDH